MLRSPMSKTRIPKTLHHIVLAAVLIVSGVLSAMEPMTEEGLAAVAARDGIVLSLSGENTSVNQVQWVMDAGSANEASLMLEGIDVSGHGVSAYGVSLSVDVGSDGAGVPYVAIHGSWSDLQVVIDSLSHQHSPTNSIGSFALRSSGQFDLANQDGPFNASSDQAYFRLQSSGDIYYRQGPVGSPEISFGDLAFNIGFTDGAGGPGAGRVGLDQNGLVLQSDFMDFDLNFDLYFSAEPIQAFDAATREPIILTGWAGGVRNATLQLNSGGVGYGSGSPPVTHPDYARMVTAPAAINPVWAGLQYFNHDGSVLPGNPRSDGLNILAQWDYDTDFRWILGQAAGDRVRVDFFDWRRLGGASNPASHDFIMPITLDALNAGQGAGGLCFGGSLPSAGALSRGSCDGTGGVPNIGGHWYNSPPKDNNLAVVIRDARLHAYNTRVRVTDPAAAPPFNEEVFDWSLLYTFGKMDANIYFYPGGFSNYALGQASSNSTGLSADVLLTIQSPGYWRAAQANFNPGLDPGIDPTAASRWATNTHFMIADTAVGGDPDQSFGVGLINADMVWQVENFNIELWDEATGFPGLALIAQDLGKYAFRGLLGAGSLNDLSSPIRVALLDVNIETDSFIFVLSAPDYSGAGEQFVGFDALFDFNGNAYISLAEPSSPQADFRFGDIRGRLMWRDGRIELISGQNTLDGKPKLEIENRILVGRTGLNGDPLIGTVSFGGDPLGRIAARGGDWYSRIALKKQ